MIIIYLISVFKSLEKSVYENEFRFIVFFSLHWATVEIMVKLLDAAGRKIRSCLLLHEVKNPVVRKDLSSNLESTPAVESGT